MTLGSISLINGLSCGLEFIPAMPEEDIEKSMIIDVFFLRFIFEL